MNHAINRDSIFVCAEALTLFSGFYGEKKKREQHLF